MKRSQPSIFPAVLTRFASLFFARRLPKSFSSPLPPQEARWLAAGMDLAASCSDFLQQMAYREYSRYISFHFPFSHQRSLLEHLVRPSARSLVHRAVQCRMQQSAYYDDTL